MLKCINHARKNLRRKAENQGITLIALVITVIILLILAGTAITLSINGGNLSSKTNEAANEWNTAVAKEENALSNVLQILDMAANPDLAEYKLTVTVNENGTVESPYYVYFPSAKFINESEEENCKGIKCRVLYNDSTYGLQVISVNPVTKLMLGSTDPSPLEKVEGDMGSIERGKNSYNRAITTLNEKAEEYIATANGSILATDARCVGSNPLDKNYPDNLQENGKQEQMLLITEEHNNNSIGEYYKTDTHYETDYNRLDKIGARIITDDLAMEKTYWLASRLVDHSDSYNADAFSIRYVPADSEASFRGLMYIYHSNRFAMQGGGEMGIRPVFKLALGVKIVGGKGTLESPFEIGL